MAFWRLYYHLVWATKNREPLIQPNVEKQLYPYIVNKASELEVFVYAINGWDDHIHLVVSIPPKHAVASVVKHLKGSSSHYLNHKGEAAGSFGWQRGYGALSVGEQHRAVAEAYVRKQKEHHQAQTTNGWLERYTELDEGPPDTIPDVVREQPAVYDVLGEPLF